jgi:hypothetical protein
MSGKRRIFLGPTKNIKLTEYMQPILLTVHRLDTAASDPEMFVVDLVYIRVWAVRANCARE